MITLLDALLAPIARLAVARGLLFTQVSERLKLQYLRGAERLAGGDKPPTDSRISVMTGLQRRDIARLRQMPADPVPPVNPLARLVAQWLALHGGRPLPRSGDGSFDALAAQIRKDVHPKTLLEQLVAAGTVEVKGEEVTLCTASYQPLPGSDDQLAYLTANGGDYLAAATANVLTAPAPFFERAVHYNQLSPQAVDTLDAAFRERQAKLLQDINDMAARLQDTSPGQARFRAGGYFYSEGKDT